ncbi:hypothetical protein ACFYO5_09825 [Streptomyces sp. NPDC006259]|uniref:hypothetical protein n=1 Tax=Streptomyces sp. NPDC006259 TaxID=3364740 RepID=UPI0036B6D646
MVAERGPEAFADPVPLGPASWSAAAPADGGNGGRGLRRAATGPGRVRRGPSAGLRGLLPGDVHQRRSGAVASAVAMDLEIMPASERPGGCVAGTSALPHALAHITPALRRLGPPSGDGLRGVLAYIAPVLRRLGPPSGDHEAHAQAVVIRWVGLWPGDLAVVVRSVALPPGDLAAAPEAGTFPRSPVAGGRPTRPDPAGHRLPLVAPREPAAVITECVGAMR